MEVRGLTLKGEKPMMKAIKNFTNKPITWGDSFKWSGTFLGLYAAVIGACVAYEKWTNYKAEKEMQMSTRRPMTTGFMCFICGMRSPA